MEKVFEQTSGFKSGGGFPRRSGSRPPWRRGRENLSYNQLETLPKIIGNLSNLQILWLAHNHLSSLPEEMGRISTLEYLDLESNILESLPETVSQLVDLKWINLRGNRFEKPP